jgi:hypothetical protein
MNLKTAACWIGYYELGLGLAELGNQNSSSTILASIASLPSVGGYVDFGSINAAYVDILLGLALMYYGHMM